MNKNSFSKTLLVNTIDWMNKEKEIKQLLFSLLELGYTETFNCLEKESNFFLNEIQSFHKSILNGDWKKSLELTEKLFKKEDQKNIIFLINRQKYIEEIYKKNFKDAIETLKEIELVEQEQHLKLSTLLLCKNEEELKKRSKYGITRETLLKDCFSYLQEPKDKMVPTDQDVELYDHEEDIWYVDWSDKYLCTCSKDGNILVYENGKKTRIIRGHFETILMIKLNGDYLLSCSDKLIVIWDLKDDSIVWKHKGKSISCCTWINNKTIGFSTDRSFFIYNMITLSEWKIGHKVQDCLMWKDNIVMITYRKIYIYKNEKDFDIIHENDAINSISIKGDLLSCVSGERGTIRVWNLNEKCLIREYRTNIQTKYVTRTCFGNGYIIFGSEDGRLFIFDLDNSKCIAEIKGHDSVVNCVVFNENLNKFASVSDGGKLKIWKYAKREKVL